MDDLELTRTIAQVRRAMPRNEAVMTICDALEQRVQTLRVSREMLFLALSRLRLATQHLHRQHDVLARVMEAKVHVLAQRQTPHIEPWYSVVGAPDPPGLAQMVSVTEIRWR